MIFCNLWSPTQTLSSPGLIALDCKSTHLNQKQRFVRASQRQSAAAPHDNGTYPGHDPEAGVRLLEERERLEGSTGSARAVRAPLHPVHQPPARSLSALWRWGETVGSARWLVRRVLVGVGDSNFSNSSSNSSILIPSRITDRWIYLFIYLDFHSFIWFLFHFKVDF